MAEEALLNFVPAAFFPSISYSGTEPKFVIRGQNFFLKSKSQDSMYAIAYKGSRDIGEIIPTFPLTGLVSWDFTVDPYVLNGTNFIEELRPGSFLLVNTGTTSVYFTVEEVTSNTQARVSRAFTTTEANKQSYIMPIMFPLGYKRATQIRGNTVKYPRGHLLGVGMGEFRLNGQSLRITQVETLTVIGTVGAAGAGNIDVTVIAAGMTGTPITVMVALANNDTATQVAAKIATAFKLNANIGNKTTGFFLATSAGATVILLWKTAAANDATANISYVNTTSTGLTNVPTSANTTPGMQFNLDKKPIYALYNPTTDSYTLAGYGISLPQDNATFPLITLSEVAGGTKAMFAAKYGIRVVAKSDPSIGGTGGYSQPSAAYTFTTTTVGKKLRITFNQAMSESTGQNAWDIYVTKYIDATQTLVNSVLGPWYWYETVTETQLATENSVADGAATGLFHDLEFGDGELEVLNRLLTFDNFGAYDAEYVDLIASESGVTPVFFSLLGKTSPTKKEGTSPGASLAVGKPDNPEALMRDKAVSTFEGDTILGVLGVRGRHWLLCENSLQTAILTGIPRAPMTIRSFWDVGFRNPYNLKFIKDYVFGHSTGGFLRSIGVGDTSDTDFEFSTPIDDYVTDWITSQELTGYDPKNKAVCFFFSGREKQSGYYVTLVLPFLPNQGFWNPPILLKKANQDFIVSGVATVGQAMYFLAGGRTSAGAIDVRTYEFDSNDGVALDCYLAWAYTDMGLEDTPQSVRGVSSFIGNATNAKVEIHGVSASGVYNLSQLDAGHGTPALTIDLGTTAGLGRIQEKRQNVEQFSKWACRLSMQSTNGSGRVDELNMLVNTTAGSRK